MKRFWYDCQKSLDFSVDGMEVLRVACQSLNRYLEAKEAIDKIGIIYKAPNGMVKKNPACEVEKHSRQGFLQAVKMLGIDPGNEQKRGPGRPTVHG